MEMNMSLSPNRTLGDDAVTLIHPKLPDQPILVAKVSQAAWEESGWKVAPKADQVNPDAAAAAPKEK
jgi:hypothetical protein